ncbi:hypothetical protein [Kitasatospora sp. MAA4]|uniref:hypothetical protein n=1 Tax=Kitasatospora sp. MAA4 TaxID=3035093 RepID=UPI0024734C0A|nr:hypothetical protein [Kitasatospora sp. MAA4]
MASHLDRRTVEARQQVADALAELIAALELAGIVLPSLGVDWHSGKLTGVYLIDLGAARPDVILLLAKVVRVGANYAQP